MVETKRSFWIYWKIAFLFVLYAWTSKFVGGMWFLIPLVFACFELSRELRNYETIILDYRINLKHKKNYQNFWKDKYLDLNDKLDNVDYLYERLKNVKENDEE